MPTFTLFLFPVPGFCPEHHITFCCHASLGSLRGWEILRFFLIFDDLVSFAEHRSGVLQNVLIWVGLILLKKEKSWEKDHRCDLSQICYIISGVSAVYLMFTDDVNQIAGGICQVSQCYFALAVPHGLWDLSSLSRD